MSEEWGHFILIDDKERKYNELKNSNMVILSKIMFHLCVITTLIISSLKSITSKLSFSKS